MPRPIGGALARLASLARWGLGGTVGSGTQGMSWIHELDMNRLFERGLREAGMHGAYIASAPAPVVQQPAVVAPAAAAIVVEPAVVAQPAAVEAAPVVEAAAFDAPEAAFSGQQVTLRWTVRNDGDAAQNPYWWYGAYDQVFLSSDPFLDNGDLSLGFAGWNNQAGGGNEVERSLQVSTGTGVSDRAPSNDLPLPEAAGSTSCRG